VVGIRPERYSYEMVKETGDFVLNIPSTSEFETAKFVGTKSGRDYDKFEACNLTIVPSSKVKSPMIGECPMNIECKVREIHSLGAHDLFVAEVVEVHLDKSVLDDSGRFDPSKIELFTYLPLSGQYWALGERLA
jgi:flavin reductase (DIM6/NTAB) family NADH-FMN oxidoreductase RutF